MPFSEFTRMVKCANMLNARQRLVDIRVSSFAQMKDNARIEFQRELMTMSDFYLVRKVKDYREVLGNLAKRIMKNGR